jgi:predicted transposase YdaD
LVLLHRGADSPRLTGLYARGFPGEMADITLRYRIVRLWEVPAGQWLAGGLGLVPLAPLGDVRPQELPAVVAQMKARHEREAPPALAADLWSAAYILMGVRYERAVVQQLLQGVVAMKESTTYQAIIEEGMAKGQLEEVRKILLLVGRQQLGEPSAEARAAVSSLTDLAKLEELTLRSSQATSWHELLGLNGAGRRGRTRKKRS